MSSDGAHVGSYAENEFVIVPWARVGRNEIARQVAHRYVALGPLRLDRVHVAAVEPLAHMDDLAAEIDVLPLQADNFGYPQGAKQRHLADEAHVAEQGFQESTGFVGCSFRWCRTVFFLPTDTLATGFASFQRPHSMALVKMPDMMLRRSVRVLQGRPATILVLPEMSTIRGLPFSASQRSISRPRISPSILSVRAGRMWLAMWVSYLARADAAGFSGFRTNCWR